MNSSENSSLCFINDIIEIKWILEGNNDNESYEKIEYKVVNIEKCKKEKKGSLYKYELKRLNDESNTENLFTRLNHLNWKLKSNKKKNNNNNNNNELIFKKRKSNYLDNINNNSILNNNNGDDKKYFTLPIHKHILAPMVGGSELAFRLLCRRYGTQLAYTPMINSERFAVDSLYRDEIFQTNEQDRPLVAHFSSNNPKTMLQAALLVQDRCDAIDLNLGCPQRVAFVGHYGSFLLDDVDRPLVLSIVKTLADNIKIPVFVKIRLLETVPDTIKLCHQLAESGAALIAIHARYRVNLSNRTGPGARDGPAHLNQIIEIKKSLSNFICKSTNKKIAVIANGNIRCHDDVNKNLEYTGADGVMSAEGILDNPAIFSPEFVDKSSNTLSLALEYLDIVEKYPVTMKCVIFHVRRMCKDDLNRYQLMEEVVASKDINEVRSHILLAIQFTEKGDFVYDSLKEKKAEEAFKRRLANVQKRKVYEGRMVRKAKREGLDLEHYLQLGAKTPSVEELKILKSMTKDENFTLWKEKHSQHCYAYHFDSAGCLRDRTCAFLHADPSYVENTEKFG